MLSRTSFLLLSFACLWVGCRSNVDIFGPIGSTGAGAEAGGTLVGGSGSSVGETVSSTATTSGGGSASVCGDGQCDGGETPRSCPEDCERTNTCEHPVCEVGEALESGCESCVTKVCAEDDYCCTDWWDDTCIALADRLCGAGCCGNGMCEGQTCATCPDDCGVCVCGDGNCEGENCSDCAQDCGPCPSCGHTSCAAGAALSLSECRPACVEDVCAKDPNCCQTSWSPECTALAASLCSGPDPCVEKVCAKDSACCMSGWGTGCVEVAKVACATKCDCQHKLCDTGNALTEKCDPCVASICAADPYCCQNDWDGVCVDEVGSICGIVCN